MTTFNYEDEVALQQRMATDAVREVRRFGGVLTGNVASMFERLLTSATPVGGSKDRHRGLMQRSWRRFAVTAQGGRAWGMGNTTAYGGIINRGRRRSQSFTSVKAGKRTSRTRRNDALFARLGYKSTGKWLGSLQAPKGVTKPAWNILKRLERQITDRSVAEAKVA